ncbi:hypothetical protein MTO96_045713 [Rhipicephalus appendiculatus]
MADPRLQTAGNRRRRRPCVLRWNANSLRRRQADLSLYLLRSEYDVLALQEVNVSATHLRLPGYIGYQSATSLCVRRELPHAHINVAHVTGGAFEWCAVTVRLRGVDTTVASVYVRPGQRWSATELLKLTARL